MGEWESGRVGSEVNEREVLMYYQFPAYSKRFNLHLGTDCRHHMLEHTCFEWIQEQT